MLEPSPQIAGWTASDGYESQYRCYDPGQPPRAHVIGLHGIQSHGGWYQHSCSRLCAAGYMVYYLDRRGSGLNQRDRGDAPGFRRLLDDVADFIDCRLPKAENRAPVVLLAVSWGGKLAAGLCRRHPGKIDGLALLCPGFFPVVKPPLGERLGIFFARLLHPRRMFPVPLSDPGLFTATPRWQEFIANDPIAVRQATARLLVESVRLDLYLRFFPPRIEVPVLLMLAGQDRIIDSGRTRQLVERIATADRQMIDYPDAHHTLEFEPDPERHIDDLIKWLGALWP